MLGRMDSYIYDYEHIFKSKTRCVFTKAQLYCKDVFVRELSNTERVSEEMFANYHQMQHFISESPWDYRELMDQVSLDVIRSLPRKKLTGLIIDESKRLGEERQKERRSMYTILRQYWQSCNSHVAVFGALSKGDFTSIIDTRLYPPKSWSEDEFRC